jgi:thymidylate synthase (FAD)
MKVSLVSYTQPPPPTTDQTTDQTTITETTITETTLTDLVVYCARVSNPANQNNTLNNKKLISYLIKHEHWSPFEMVSICLEIETTRDIARQILRHRSFSFQEFSQRYAVADLGFKFKELRMQDHTNRQNSIILDDPDNPLIKEWKQKQNEIAESSKEVYKWAIDNGIAKEQARSVLPEGMTVSRLYMNGTLRSWIHYIKIRSNLDTQKEHRDVAVECAKVISEIFPSITDFILT